MIAEELKSDVARHNFIKKARYTVYLSVSVGIYNSVDGEVSEDKIVSFADEASYIAKNSGKNRVVVKAPA